MPYVDLVSSDDYVSIWYTTNSRHNSVSTFDTTKPTIILLHPFSLDSSWLGQALGDPRLDEDYNMIAFDLRFSGKTIERPNARLDCWVQAADLAFACEALHVFRAHLWAEETISVNIALRFAMLFPEMCLSLALVTVPSPSEQHQDLSLALNQAIRPWCFAEEMDTMNHAAARFLDLTVGADLDIDQIVAYWQTQYLPFKRTRTCEMKNSMLNHAPLTKSQLATIRQPVLILHGENNPTYPLKCAQQLREDLINSKVMLSVIKGAAGFMSITPSSAPTLHRIYVDFLGGLPSPPSDPSQPTDPDCMKRALVRLAELATDPSIASRSLKSPMSFSLVSPGVGQSKDLNVLMQGTNTGFSPFPHDRQSERNGFIERTKGLFHRRSDSRLHVREGSLP